MSKIEIKEARGAVSRSITGDVIDLEINHPTLGWIPYTISPEDTDTTIDNNKLRLLVGNNLAPYQEVVTVYSSMDVNIERDRRLRAGFTFAVRGTPFTFDSDEASIKRITGAATLAGFAIGAGAPEGYRKWHGGSTDFAWITQNNEVVPLDAHEMLSLGKMAANWESRHVFMAHYLKSFPSIPLDYTEDKYWN